MVEFIIISGEILWRLTPKVQYSVHHNVVLVRIRSQIYSAQALDALTSCFSKFIFNFTPYIIGESFLFRSLISWTEPHVKYSLKRVGCSVTLLTWTEIQAINFPIEYFSGPNIITPHFSIWSELLKVALCLHVLGALMLLCCHSRDTGLSFHFREKILLSEQQMWNAGGI
jgi:hypothetical protein